MAPPEAAGVSQRVFQGFECFIYGALEFSVGRRGRRILSNSGTKGIDGIPPGVDIGLKALLCCLASFLVMWFALQVFPLDELFLDAL